MEIHGRVGGGRFRAAAAPQGHAQSVRVRQVHDLRHAKLPAAPALLLIGNEDDRSDHFDGPD
jgi:hypothetical protein